MARPNRLRVASPRLLLTDAFVAVLRQHVQSKLFVRAGWPTSSTGFRGVARGFESTPKQKRRVERLAKLVAFEGPLCRDREEVKVDPHEVAKLVAFNEGHEKALAAVRAEREQWEADFDAKVEAAVARALAARGE